MPGIYRDFVDALSLGVGTAKTQLDGGLTGSASSYKTPTSCQGILWVQPHLNIVTPTANESSIASMAVESQDLAGWPIFEVLATPTGGSVATTNHAFFDRQDQARYPIMYDVSDYRAAGNTSAAGIGNANINFFGIPQVANTAAPFMGASLWWTDIPGLALNLRTMLGSGVTGLPNVPFKAQVGGAYAAAGGSTSTGTAAGLVTGKTMTISGTMVRTMRGLYGLLAPTTTVTLKPFSGRYEFGATELPYLQRLGMEPLQGILGTAQQAAHLTKDEMVQFSFITPTTINLNANFKQISSTAGNWVQGILYQ